MDPFRGRTYTPPPFLKAMGVNTPLYNESGYFLSEACFLERRRPGPEGLPVYTLEQDDREFKGKQLYSLHKRFVKAGDPTGYEIGKAFFGSWKNAQKVYAAYWFQPYLEEMVSETVTRLRTLGLEALKAQTKDGNLKAAESLMSYNPDGTQPKKAPRGRPSKHEVKATAREMAQEDKDVLADIERLKDQT
jgi:hypothetical protein